MMLWILELGMLALAVYVFVTGRAKIGPWPVSGSMALVLAALLTMPLLVGVLGSLVLWLGPGSNNSIWEYLFLFSVLSLVVGVFASSSLSGEGVVVASEGTTEEKLPSLDQTSIRSDLPRRQLRADLSDVLSPPQARRKGRSVVVAALCLAGTLAFASMAAYGWQFLQKASGASQVAASDEQKQGAAGNQQPDDGQPVAEMEVVPPQTPVVKDKVEYPHPHTVSGLTFSPNGKILVTVCNDRWFRFWDVATGQVLLRVSSPGYVWGVEYSPDGRWLALHGEGLFLCDGKTGEVRGRFLQDRKTCRGVAFSADSNTLLAISRTSVEHGNYEHKLHAIDLRRLKEFPFDVNLGEYSKVVIEEVKILANDKHVYIGAHGVTRDQRVSRCDRIVELSTGKVVKELKTFAKYTYSHARLSPDGERYLLLGSQLAPHPGLVYDLVKNRSLKPLPTAGAEFVDFASDSRTAIVRSGGNVSLWDVDRNSQLGFVEAGGQTSSRVVMSPDGRLMAACSGMRVISWNVQAVLDGKIR